MVSGVSLAAASIAVLGTGSSLAVVVSGVSLAAASIAVLGTESSLAVVVTYFAA